MSAPCPILGFTVVVELNGSVADAQADALAHALAALLEAQGLTVEGGGRRRARFVVRRDGSQATESDRQLVIGWAMEWSDVATITVSDIIDLSPAS